MLGRVLIGTLLATALAALTATAQQPREAVTLSTDWLASQLRDPNLVLLHVGAEAEYRVAHIPGAHFVRQQDFAAPARAGELSLQMPSASELRQRLQALGINERSHIVVYFGNDWVSPATRILFTLHAAGLGERADLLNGGMPKWRREGRALTADNTPPPRAGALPAFTLQPTVVDAAFVRANADRPGYVVIDARARVYYDGVEQGGAHGHERRGRIAGARSLPFTSVTNDDLTLKSAAALEALFRAAGVGAGDRAIVYCHIGQQGTAVVLAARAAGVDAVLYDGSFEDWSIRNLPVEQ